MRIIRFFKLKKIVLIDLKNGSLVVIDELLAGYFGLFLTNRITNSIGIVITILEYKKKGSIFVSSSLITKQGTKKPTAIPNRPEKYPMPLERSLSSTPKNLSATKGGAAKVNN